MTAINRNVTVRLHEDFLESVSENKENVDTAIGYLVAWAINSPRYAKVTIYGDSEGHLHASYFNAEGDLTYQMMAHNCTDEINKKANYSFHS